MTTDAATRFSNELAVLRDSVVRALRQDNATDLKHGLELYTSLIDTVLEQFRRYQDVVGPTGAGLFSFYGREMSWLEDDTRTFVKGAVADPGSDSTQAVLGFILGLARRALDRRELPAFGAFLRQLTFAWHEGRRVLEGHGWERLRDNLLLTLENFGDYWVGRQLTTESEEVDPYAQRLIAELAQLMKESVDRGAVDDLAAATRTLGETMRYSIADLELSRDGAEHPVATAKAAAVLAVEAWVQFRHATGKSSVDQAVPLIEALRDAPTKPTWLAFMALSDHRSSDWLGVTTWETSSWSGTRAGVLTFDRYITRAFAYQLLERRATVPGELSDPAGGVRHRVEQLRDAIDEIAIAPPDPTRSSSIEVGRSDDVRSQLEARVHDLQAAEDRRLVELPLDPEKVAEFRRAAIEAWMGPRHLRHLGSESPWERGPESATAPSGLGINRLTAKDYFVEQPHVHADPLDLGREYGNGLARGEDLIIIEELVARLPSRVTTLGAMLKEVNRAVTELRARDLNPVVLVLNSWEVVEALRDEIAPDGAWATADLDEAPRLKTGDTPVLLRYGENHDVCIVADFNRAFEIEYSRAIPELPNDQPSPDGRILTGVEPIDRQRALDLMKSSPALRHAGQTGGELDEESAIRTVRKSVQVRVLEWVRVRVPDTSAGVVLVADVPSARGSQRATDREDPQK